MLNEKGMIPKVKGGGCLNRGSHWEFPCVDHPLKFCCSISWKQLWLGSGGCQDCQYFPHVHSTSKLTLPHTEGRGMVTTLSTLPCSHFLMVFVLTISRMQGWVGSPFSCRLLVSVVFHCEMGYVLSRPVKRIDFPFVLSDYVHVCYPHGFVVCVPIFLLPRIENQTSPPLSTV